MKIMFKQSKGFTLIELMVVMTILSVLAGIVVPAVTGTTTAGRGTTMTADVNTVQNAVERFVGDNPRGSAAGWPTNDGTLPTVTKPIHWAASFVDKSDNVSIKTFGAGPVKAGASTDAKIGSSYLRTAIPHAGATRAADDKTSVLTDALTFVLTVTAAASAPNITLVNTVVATTSAVGYKIDGTDDTTPNAGHYPVWRIDSTGKVYVNLNASEY